MFSRFDHSESVAASPDMQRGGLSDSEHRPQLNGTVTTVDLVRRGGAGAELVAGRRGSRASS